MPRFASVAGGRAGADGAHAGCHPTARRSMSTEAPAGTSIEERFDAPGMFVIGCSVEKSRDTVLVLAVDIGASSDERDGSIPGCCLPRRA